MHSTSGQLRLLSVVVLLTTLVTGCAGTDSVAPSVDLPQETETSSVSPAIETVPIEEQVSIVTGRDDVKLIAIDGSDSWLGGVGLAAYVDPATHDEFIIDSDRNMLLAYDPGTAVYQEPADSPTYPGEPSRDEIMQLAQEWATEYLPERDIASMRCTALRRVIGEIVEYTVEYRRYVHGVRMPEMASVTITLPISDWTPSRSAFEHADEYETPPQAQTTMLEALEAAQNAAGFSECSVQSVNLNWWKDTYRWSIELENLTVDPPQFGGHASWIEVDAVTGEVLGVTDCL